MAIRNDQIFELLKTVHEELSDLKVCLARINGRLGTVENIVRKIPCTQHNKDIAVLKEQVGSQGTNWNRVINIALAVGQALLIVLIVSRLGS